MRARTIIVGLLLWAVALGLEPSNARAEPELTLRWPAQDDCPDGAFVERAVATQLGRALGETHTTLFAEAEIEAKNGGYRLVLRTQQGALRGSRTLRAARCRELAEAAALVLALGIEEQTRAPAGVEDADMRPAGVATERQPLAPEALPQRAADRPPLLFTLASAALGELGFLPRVGAGVALEAGLTHARSRFVLGLLVLLPVRTREADDGRVEVFLWAARAGYCARWGERRLALLPCAGVELGRAHGNGLSLEAERARRFPWVAGYLSARLALAVSRSLSLFLEPALAAPVLRRRFVSSDATGMRRAILHEPDAVSGRLALGLEVTF